MSAEPYNRLVKLVARAFYDDITMKGDTQPKTGRSDNRGMAVVILDALTRRQWVREEDLAKDLKLHAKQLRRTLRFFEEEKLITRDHRKETAKGAKIFSAAVAATGDGLVKEGEEKLKLHTHSYCCLDYAQIHDVVRYRLHRMKKKLKDELESRNTVQEYICPSCSRRYTALDALRLISLSDEYFHCENCDAILVAESDKLASDDMGDGDDKARARRHEKLKDILQKMDVELKPLTEQLARIKDLPPPEFGTLQAWEARASAAARANGNSDANDPSKSSQGQGYGGTAMPYLGETKVEVALSGVKEEDTKADAGSTAMKVLPPWMIKEGMQLTNEQRGEVKQEVKMDNNSSPLDRSDDKKSVVHEKNDEMNIQDEYVKAYYAALLKRQQEEEATKVKQEEHPSHNVVLDNATEVSLERQVGLKAKRSDDESEDDIEWEETPIAGGSTGAPMVDDLNVEPDASEDAEDDIDWEEG
ncbi:hypothetical protein AQUCO_00201090v1 [Aquilegia coerulea]|uniref:HTH TFE/IIEalpha-type domain-containing protein n=2 Tax=Aquilegia coerulea TaxID=218851 RepID=A0A2G5F683_AQUCA|nr:hypothetical protein AQUCO_00201090v1 [Aquilegia coerulea]